MAFRSLCRVCCRLGDEGGAGAGPHSPEWRQPQVSFLTQSLTGAPKQVGQQALALLPARPTGGRRVAGQQARGWETKEPENNPSLVQPPGAAQGGPAPLAGSSLGLQHTANPSSLTQTHCDQDWPEPTVVQAPRSGCATIPVLPGAEGGRCHRPGKESQILVLESETISHCASLPLSTWCWADSRANAFSKWFTKGFAKLTPQDALKVPVLAEG